MSSRWLSEHRVPIVAAVLVMIGIDLAAVIMVAGSGRAEEAPKPGSFPFEPDVDDAVPVQELAAELGRQPPSGELAGLRRPKTPPDEGAHQFGRGVGQSCPKLGVQGVVDSDVSGVGCAGARAIASSWGNSPDSEIRGYVCSAGASGLSVSCIDPGGGGSLELIFGPGAPGLAECGQAPVGTDAVMVPVRASIACDEATSIAFRFHVRGDRRFGGYSCEPVRQAGIEVVRCGKGPDEVAFGTA